MNKVIVAGLREYLDTLTESFGFVPKPIFEFMFQPSTLTDTVKIRIYTMSHNGRTVYTTDSWVKDISVDPSCIYKFTDGNNCWKQFAVIDNKLYELHTDFEKEFSEEVSFLGTYFCSLERAEIPKFRIVCSVVKGIVLEDKTKFRMDSVDVEIILLHTPDEDDSLFWAEVKFSDGVRKRFYNVKEVELLEEEN